MKKKKLLVVILLLLVLVSSFFIVNKKTNIKFKKLKELNYNVTYKEAFPDENLRRGVLLCIMRNKCGEEQANNEVYSNYNSFDYEFRHNAGFYHYQETYGYENNFGSTPITYEEIVTKENEKIRKEDLERLEVLIANQFSKEVTTIKGIEYLTNLRVIVLNQVTEENVDLSYNPKLEHLYLNVIEGYKKNNKIKNIKLDNNLKLKNIAMKLTKESLDFSNLSDLEDVYIIESKLNNIILPTNIKYIDLSGNNISSINLNNNTKIEKLYLEANPIETIDLTKLTNLKKINLSDTKIKGSIDFKNNINLAMIVINNNLNTVRYKKGDIKLEDIDLSKNIKLKKLELYNVGLKKISLDKNLDLEWLNLANNNLEKLDISNNDKLECHGIPSINLHDNKITNLKVSELVACGGNIQRVNLKVKLNEAIEIPLYFNDRKVYLKDSDNFIREGDKYKFNKLGTFKEKVEEENRNGFEHFIEFTIEVKKKIEDPTEADNFVPKIDQKDYYPLTCEKVSVSMLKDMITNLPKNIQNFEIIKPTKDDYLLPGENSVKVRITFNDGSKKDFEFKVKFYEETIIKPTIKTIPENIEVLDGKHVDITISREFDEEERIDENTNKKYIKTNKIYSNFTNKLAGLIYDDSKITGKIEYYFKSRDESIYFSIIYNEYGNGYHETENISIKLIRDTDKDGIADKDDDDIDGDGVSNIIEDANGSDPYNKNIVPGMTKKQIVDVLVNDFETLINEVKNKDFKNKFQQDIDNLKNNVLKEKEDKLEVIKTSYNDTTSDTDLDQIKDNLYDEIDSLKVSLNNIKENTDFSHLDYELSKPILEELYSKEAMDEINEKILEAKNLDRNITTQYDVNDFISNFLDLKKYFNKTKLKEKIENFEKAIDEGRCFDNECKETLEEAKNLLKEQCLCTTEEDIIKMINKINKVLNTPKRIENPKTGIKTYSLIILFIIFISYLVFKKHKNYIR